MREALRGLARYPLRAALALLGLVVGVSTVVGTIALLDASRRYALEAMSREASPEVVRLWSPYYRWEKGRRTPVAAPVRVGLGEAGRLRRSLPPSCEVTLVSTTDRTVQRGAVSFLVPVRGVESNARRFSPIDVVAGRFFTDVEVASAARVAILSPALAEDLFGERSPVSGELLLDGQRFDVVGVAREMRNTDGDEPRRCTIPFRTSTERFGRLGVEDVVIRIAAPSLESVPEVARMVTALLPSLRPGVGAESWQVETAEEELRFARSRDTVQTLTLTGVAGLSMLVAAGGILNTLLVGVRQRTHEIGTRRAVGATRGEILRQFLCEALLLAVPGALLGLGAGAALARSLGRTLAVGLFDPSRLVVVVGPREAALAAVAAILVSLGAGLWPALLASRVAPAEALRYE